MTLKNHKIFMTAAIQQAQKANGIKEVPIGAVITTQNQIIARAHNLTQTLNDPTAHAEMQAITAACNHLGAKYLNQCTIYVTVEPCPMCAAALKWAQIGEIIWGTDDPKFGYTQVAPQIIHPKTLITNGVMKDECAEIITAFFAKLRK